MYLKGANAYYKDMALSIYEMFGTGEFTCNQIREVRGLSKFKCQQLRAWHNNQIVEYKINRVRKGKNPERIWRFTQSSLRFFMGLP